MHTKVYGHAVLYTMMDGGNSWCDWCVRASHSYARGSSHLSTPHEKRATIANARKPYQSV